MTIMKTFCDAEVEQDKDFYDDDMQQAPVIEIKLDDMESVEEVQIEEETVSTVENQLVGDQHEDFDDDDVQQAPVIDINLDDMEVVEEGQIEEGTISTVENQLVGDQDEESFTWKIHLSEFPRFSRQMLMSPVFVVGGYKWRIWLYPLGNTTRNRSAVFLKSVGAKQSPLGSRPFARFSFEVVNQLDPENSVKSLDLMHDFNRGTDYGFPNFMPLNQLYDWSEGFWVEDSIILKTRVDVRKLVVYSADHSKKRTGFVGLRNQGATCYLNSLLQTFYHLPYFRKGVYQIPTTENDSPSESLPLALQSLFYKIQFGDTSPETGDLTKSFGWETSECFRQQDVHECNGFLCDKLEENMNDTPANGTIQQLFQGRAINSIECIDVDYKSSHTQAFYDLQLDVKGCEDVYGSFDKYVEEEKLEGDNQYNAEKFGLQDARKGTKFIEFPPVLQLHLKRFDYDFEKGTRVKINDKYEFPLQLDLDKEDGKYLSPEADRSVRNLYVLHSVLVHRGGVDSGHYYALIRPSLSDQWYKFNDDLVTKVESQTVLEEHTGGEGYKSHANAYMLSYIRESQTDMVMCTVDREDIPKHLHDPQDQKSD